jgi:conjugal transfer pilus assembly protein TraA
MRKVKKVKEVGKRFAAYGLPAAALVAAWSVSSYAGTGGTEFQDIYDTLTQWSQGALGKTISAGAFLTGIAMGVVRQSIISVVTGIGAALAVNYTPTIIDSVVTAVI